MLPRLPICSSPSRTQCSVESARQTRPRASVTRKLIAAASANSAAISRSPSPWRSRSSRSRTMRPAASSSAAIDTGSAVAGLRTRSSGPIRRPATSSARRRTGAARWRQRELFGFAGPHDPAGDGAGVVADLGDPDRLPLDPFAHRADREDAVGGQALGVEQSAVLGDVEAEAELIGAGAAGGEQAREDRRRLPAEVEARARTVDDPVDLDHVELMGAGRAQEDAGAAAAARLERDDRGGTGLQPPGVDERVVAVGDLGGHAEAVDVPEALVLGEEAFLFLQLQRLPQLRGRRAHRVDHVAPVVALLADAADLGEEGGEHRLDRPGLGRDVEAAHVGEAGTVAARDEAVAGDGADPRPALLLAERQRDVDHREAAADDQHRVRAPRLVEGARRPRGRRSRRRSSSARPGPGSGRPPAAGRARGRRGRPRSARRRPGSVRGPGRRRRPGRRSR